MKDFFIIFLVETYWTCIVLFMGSVALDLFGRYPEITPRIVVAAAILALFLVMSSITAVINYEGGNEKK